MSGPRPTSWTRTGSERRIDLASNRLRGFVAVVALAAGLAGLGCPGFGATATDPAPERPIIAEIFADAEGYEGRRVVVYGVVIDTAAAGARFLLQDVSQMPIEVVVRDGMTGVRPGDELLVEGVMVLSGGKPVLESSRIEPTQVLGGGGCC